MSHSREPAYPGDTRLAAIHAALDARVVVRRYELRGIQGKQLDGPQRVEWGRNAVAVLGQVQNELRKLAGPALSSQMHKQADFDASLAWCEALLNRFKIGHYRGIRFTAQQRQRWAAEVADMLDYQRSRLEDLARFHFSDNIDNYWVRQWQLQYEALRRPVKPLAHIKPFEPLPEPPLSPEKRRARQVAWQEEWNEKVGWERDGQSRPVLPG